MSETKETVSSNATNIDKTKANAFMDKVFRDITGTYISLMCCIGDRLDLFKNLEINGPATSIELSNISGTNERYTREWLNAMASQAIYNMIPQASVLGFLQSIHRY